MSFAGTKRSASSETENSVYDYSHPDQYADYTEPNDTTEKKKRFQLPPKLIGPLTFNGDSSGLHKAVFPAQPSNLPGVFRLTPPEHVPIRLWTPLWPFTTYLETPLTEVIESIDTKCILIFDSRENETQSIFGNKVPHGFLNEPIIKKFGVIVSRFPPPTPDVLTTPYIQDPTLVLGGLCRYYDYLGAGCVLVKNNEVVSTLMFRDDIDTMIEAVNEWAYL